MQVRRATSSSRAPAEASAHRNELLAQQAAAAAVTAAAGGAGGGAASLDAAAVYDWEALVRGVDRRASVHHIRHLALDALRLSQTAQWDWLALVLPALTQLRHLGLRECGVTDRWLCALLQPPTAASAGSSGSCAGLGGGGPRVAAGGLSPLIEVLDLSFNQSLTYKSCAAIGKFTLRHADALAELLLEGNHLHDHGAQILAVHLLKMNEASVNSEPLLFPTTVVAMARERQFLRRAAIFKDHPAASHGRATGGSLALHRQQHASSHAVAGSSSSTLHKPLEFGLRMLNLSKNGCSARGLRDVIAAAACSSRLAVLTLNSNNPRLSSAAAAAALGSPLECKISSFPALPAFCRLEDVDLSGVHLSRMLTVSGVRDLLLALLFSCELLLSLDLSFSFPMMTAPSAAAAKRGGASEENNDYTINPLLHVSPTQVEEQLQKQVRVGDVLCGLLFDAVDAVFVRHTAPSLPLSFRSLRGVNLEGSGLSDSGVAKLVAAATQCPQEFLPSLQWLSLAHNFLSVDGCMSIIRLGIRPETYALSKNLQALHIGGNVLASSPQELDVLCGQTRQETLIRNQEQEHRHGTGLLQIFVGKFNGQPMSIDAYAKLRNTKQQQQQPSAKGGAPDSSAAPSATLLPTVKSTPTKTAASSGSGGGLLVDAATPPRGYPTLLPASSALSTPGGAAGAGNASTGRNPPSAPISPYVLTDTFLSPIVAQQGASYHLSASSSSHLLGGSSLLEQQQPHGGAWQQQQQVLTSARGGGSSSSLQPFGTLVGATGAVRTAYNTYHGHLQLQAAAAAAAAASGSDDRHFDAAAAAAGGAASLAEGYPHYHAGNVSTVSSTSADNHLGISPSRRRPRRKPLLSPSAAEEEDEAATVAALSYEEDGMASRQRSAVLFHQEDQPQQQQQQRDTSSGLVETPRDYHSAAASQQQQQQQPAAAVYSRSQTMQATAEALEQAQDRAMAAAHTAAATGTADDGTETTNGSIVTTASDKIAARKARIASTKAKRAAKKLLPEDNADEPAKEDPAAAAAAAAAATDNNTHSVPDGAAIAAADAPASTSQSDVASSQPWQFPTQSAETAAAAAADTEAAHHTELANASQSIPQQQHTVAVAEDAAQQQQQQRLLITRTRIPRDPLQLAGRMRTFSLTYAHPPGHLFCCYWSILKLSNVSALVQEDVLDFLQPDDDDLTHAVDKIALEVDDGIAMTTFTVTTNVKRASVAECLQRHANDMAHPAAVFPRLYHFIHGGALARAVLAPEDRYARRDMVATVRSRMQALGPLSTLNESFPSVEALVHEYHGKEASLVEELGCEAAFESDSAADVAPTAGTTADAAADTAALLQPDGGGGLLVGGPQATLVFTASFASHAEGEQPPQGPSAAASPPKYDDGAHAASPRAGTSSSHPPNDSAAHPLDDDVAISEVTASPEAAATGSGGGSHHRESLGGHTPSLVARHFLIVADDLPWTLPGDVSSFDSEAACRRSDLFAKWNGPTLPTAALCDPASFLLRAVQDVPLFLEDPRPAASLFGGEDGGLHREGSFPSAAAASSLQMAASPVLSKPPTGAATQVLPTSAALGATPNATSKSAVESPAVSTPQHQQLSRGSDPPSQSAAAAGSTTPKQQGSLSVRSARVGGGGDSADGSISQRQASFSELVEQRVSQSGDKYAFLAPQPGDAGGGGGSSVNSRNGGRGSSVSSRSRTASPATAPPPLDEQRKLLLRVRNIQRLCYACMRSNTIALNRSARNKISICKGTMQGQDVTLSVEWDVLLVLKTSHGTFGGKRILLVHPLPAKTDVMICATVTPQASEGYNSGPAASGKELVLTVEPLFLEDEMTAVEEQDSGDAAAAADGGATAAAAGGGGESDYRTAAAMLKRSRSRSFTIRVHGGQEALLAAKELLFKRRAVALHSMAQPPQGPNGASPS